MVQAVKDAGSYESFRDWFYAHCLRDIICDSTETVPCAFALFFLADGDPKTAIIYAANLGRDSDTVGTMVGAMSGALKGASGVPTDWINKIKDAAGTAQQTSKDYEGSTILLTDQFVLAEKLTGLIENRMKEAPQYLDELEKMGQE